MRIFRIHYVIAQTFKYKFSKVSKEDMEMTENSRLKSGKNATHRELFDTVHQ